jgi:hypothetical protein
MNKKNYRAECEQAVRCLNTRGFKCKLDSANGKLQLVNEKGDVNFSPTLTPKEMNLWVWGFSKMWELLDHSNVFIVWEIFADGHRTMHRVYRNETTAKKEADRLNANAKQIGMEKEYRYVPLEQHVDKE